MLQFTFVFFPLEGKGVEQGLCSNPYMCDGNFGMLITHCLQEPDGTCIKRMELYKRIKISIINYQEVFLLIYVFFFCFAILK